MTGFQVGDPVLIDYTSMFGPACGVWCHGMVGTVAFAGDDRSSPLVYFEGAKQGHDGGAVFKRHCPDSFKAGRTGYWYVPADCLKHARGPW